MSLPVATILPVTQRVVKVLPVLSPSQLLHLKLKWLHERLEVAKEISDPGERGTAIAGLAVEFMGASLTGLENAHNQVAKAKESLLYGTIEDLS